MAEPLNQPPGGVRDNVGTGAFRRRVFLVALHDHVLAGLEDDVHHFELRLDHDGAMVTGCSGSAIRHPWTVCPGALRHLDEIRGTSLTLRPRPVGPLPQFHCTHLYDLARLAIAQAVRGGSRLYDLAVSDGPVRQSVLTLDRDGQRMAAWTLDAQGKATAETVVSEGLTENELSEMRLVMRRGLSVSQIRRPGFEINRWGPPSIRSTLDQHDRQGACHAFQPPQVALGVSMANFRDSTERSDHLLAELLKKRIGGAESGHSSRDAVQNGFAKIAHLPGTALL